jgi:hypothetical protein
MEDSDTYWMIFDAGQAKGRREDILAFGEERLGPPTEAVRSQLAGVTDLDRLMRMLLRAVKAATWEEILDTP